MSAPAPWLIPITPARFDPPLRALGPVRVATLQDAPHISALFSALANDEWGGAPRRLQQGVTRFLDQPGGGFALVAEQRGRVVAALLAQRMAAVFEDSLQVCIDDVVVAPRSRRQGHARALVRGVRHVAHALDAAYVYLHVRPDNAAAVALYRSEGFSRQGDWLLDWYPGEPTGEAAPTTRAGPR